MTTTAHHTETSEDFESTLSSTASPGAVLAALRSAEAISSWWCPATGSADQGGTLEMASRSGSTFLDLRVEPSEEGRVVWSVLQAPLTPEWVGTTIVFEVEGAGDGATLRFRHRDCHVVHVPPVPNRLEQRIGEAEGQNVAHGFLA